MAIQWQSCQPGESTYAGHHYYLWGDSFAHRTGTLRISRSAAGLRDAHAGSGLDPGAVRHAFGSCSAGVSVPRLHGRSAGVGLDVARSIAGKKLDGKT
jgi:hypothetical protein